MTPNCTKEEEYWERRYFRGGNSGKGSIGHHRECKWKIITRYAPKITSVIDVGCGDLCFWEGGPKPHSYIGIDKSKTIIERNRKKRKNWKFLCAPAEKRINGIKAPIVLCMDLLFHIMNDDTYEAILRNLCHYSSQFIFINTWINNPFGDRYLGPFTDGVYQTFRRFEDYIHIFVEHGFLNHEIKLNPDKVNAVYIIS